MLLTMVGKVRKS